MDFEKAFEEFCNGVGVFVVSAVIGIALVGAIGWVLIEGIPKLYWWIYFKLRRK
jgi:hypothetical protein